MESLVDLFRHRVSAAPDTTALLCDGARLTYAELDRASDRAADHLAVAGVRPGDLTGLLAERDADTAVWLLGILKLGAAYVPLDSSYPRDRVQFIVQDSQVSFIVGARATAERLGLTDERLIDPAALPTDPPRRAAAAPSADDPAYVIYTSGSTGRPKGCVVSHRNVLALLEHALPLFALTDEDRWAVFHSFCFDFSVWELWGALATGATAVVVPWEATLSSEDLVDFLEEEEITVLNQVPSVFRYTAEAHAENGCPPLALRYVVFGGESVNLAVVRDFVAGCGPSAPHMVNMYGITENTVHSTFKTLDAAVLEAASGSPIGRPLPHVGVHLLTADRQPVADGERGELWLSGPGLASGYLHREDLTRARFVDLPLGPDGALLRCYHTGDVVRRLPDGELDFLGRSDDQVKLRGFRIELREIEAVLDSHSAVRAAAVCVVEAPSGPELAACVVPADPGARPALDLTSVKELVGASLPGYMAPRRYLTIDQLPLTPSGKLDRSAVAALFAANLRAS